MEEMGNNYKILVVYPKQRDHLRDIFIHGRIILKCRLGLKI
jgi:hypothetical protein